MRREQRLRKSSDFAASRRDGRSWANRFLVIVVRPNDLDRTRFGFVVGKRVGIAVVRNKVKRRLKEAARTSGADVGWDVVFIARKDASTADYHQLQKSMHGLMRRADIVRAGVGTGSEGRRDG
jgi:ribonuclease P protein component